MELSSDEERIDFVIGPEEGNGLAERRQLKINEPIGERSKAPLVHDGDGEA